MKLLEGEKIAEEILKDLKKRIKGRNLKLVVFLVGEDPASLLFTKAKEKACKKIGVGFELLKFPSWVNQADLEKEIKKTVLKTDIQGVVVQLPLPADINSQEIVDIIPLEKDIDVLSQKAFEKFKTGNSLVIPPVVAAIKRLFEDYKINLSGKKIVLVGAGKLVGFPISVWLVQKRINFSIIEKSTLNPEVILKQADIVISGVGKAGLIKGEMIKEGAVVVDAGSDVDFKSVSEKASYITPIRGGIGPLTVACLLENLLKLNS